MRMKHKKKKNKRILTTLKNRHHVLYGLSGASELEVSQVRDRLSQVSLPSLAPLPGRVLVSTLHWGGVVVVVVVVVVGGGRRLGKQGGENSVTIDEV